MLVVGGSMTPIADGLCKAVKHGFAALILLQKIENGVWFAVCSRSWIDVANRAR
jgi:hypothetical protein